MSKKQSLVIGISTHSQLTSAPASGSTYTTHPPPQLSHSLHTQLPLSHQAELTASRVLRPAQTTGAACPCQTHTLPVRQTTFAPLISRSPASTWLDSTDSPTAPHPSSPPTSFSPPSA